MSRYFGDGENLMNREQTIQILSILRKAYPFFYKDITREEGREITDLWYEMFKEDDILLVIKAVKLFIKTDRKGFPPVIGVIKAKMEEISEASRTDNINEFEAWQMVKDAVSNSLYNYKQEFDKLPPIIQKAVGNHYTLKDWAQTPVDTLETIIQSNFIKSYKAAFEKEENQDKLSEYLIENHKIENKALESHLKGKND